MLIYIISYLTLILIPSISAFEISHLYAPTLDSTEDMNNNSNSEFPTISDDLIYLDIKQQKTLNDSIENITEFLTRTPQNPGNKTNELIKATESSLSKISSVNLITKTDDKIKDYFVSKEIENSKQYKDDSLIIPTNYDNSQLTDPISSSEPDDCNSDEINTNKENESENINFNQINRPHIDLNDFIILIPVDKVQGIVREYYKNDKEVQRAYAYLQSQDFIELKMKILNIHEINQFLRYLNHSGLDVIDLINKLVKLCGDPEIITKAIVDSSKNENQNEKEMIESSEEIKNSSIGMAGLHGLVDSILDVLPQDQILSAFFEKLETDSGFSQFIQYIGSDMFSYLLKRIEESIQLRNLVYTLHNNGIYIARIVDSLKDYFFLGL